MSKPNDEFKKAMMYIAELEDLRDEAFGNLVESDKDCTQVLSGLIADILREDGHTCAVVFDSESLKTLHFEPISFLPEKP